MSAFGFSSPASWTFVLHGQRGELLRIKPDGSVEAESLEGAGEAGRVFIAAVRHALPIEVAKLASEGAFRMGAQAAVQAMVQRASNIVERRGKTRPATTEIIKATARAMADMSLPAFPTPPESNVGAWQWWAGSNTEFYNSGPHPSRKVAIEEGRSYFGGEEFHILEAALHPIRFSADRIINSQYYEDDDLFDHEHGEPDRTGGGAAIEAADAELQALLDGWLDRWRHTFIAPNLFAGQRNAETIPASDEAMA